MSKDNHMAHGPLRRFCWAALYYAMFVVFVMPFSIIGTLLFLFNWMFIYLFKMAIYLKRKSDAFVIFVLKMEEK